MLTEFGIHYRSESCDILYTFVIVLCVCTCSHPWYWSWSEGKKCHEYEGDSNEEYPQSLIVFVTGLEGKRHCDADGANDDPCQASQVKHPSAQSVHQRDGDESHGHQNSSHAQSRILAEIYIYIEGFSLSTNNF